MASANKRIMNVRQPCVSIHSHRYHQPPISPLPLQTNTVSTKQELGQVTADPIPGTTVRLPSESNVFLWQAEMLGPENSLYKVHYLLSLSHPATNPELTKTRAANTSWKSRCQKNTPSSHQSSASARKSTTPTSATTTKAACASVSYAATNGNPRIASEKS